MKKQTLTFGLIALMGIFILTGCEKEKEEEMTGCGRYDHSRICSLKQQLLNPGSGSLKS
ncbi:MAG: hypothetical protein MZV63_43345 [Marinilabiliales bacterium]|nr:hypothetical protein [Marinilabiliales bacterium]